MTSTGHMRAAEVRTRDERGWVVHCATPSGRSNEAGGVGRLSISRPMVGSRTTIFTRKSVTIDAVDSSSSSLTGGVVTMVVWGSSTASRRNEWAQRREVSKRHAQTQAQNRQGVHHSSICDILPPRQGGRQRC